MPALLMGSRGSWGEEGGGGTDRAPPRLIPAAVPVPAGSQGIALPLTLLGGGGGGNPHPTPPPTPLEEGSKNSPKPPGLGKRWGAGGGKGGLCLYKGGGGEKRGGGDPSPRGHRP